MSWWARFWSLFVRTDEMSAAWLRAHKQRGTRVEFDGPRVHFPVQKITDETGWLQRNLLRRRA